MNNLYFKPAIPYYCIFIIILLLINNPIKSQPDLEFNLISSWLEGPTETFEIDEDMAYISNGCVLKIADISDVSDPVILSSYDCNGQIYDLHKDGDLLYVGINEQGLYILDVSDPYNILQLSHYYMKGFYVTMALDYPYLFLSTNASKGFKILDVSNSYLPIEVSTLELSSEKKMYVVDDILYYAGGWDGLITIDISDKSEPQVLNRNQDFYAYDLIVGPIYTYIAAGDSVVIIDNTIPKNPIHVNSIYPENHWHFYKLDLDNDSLYCIGYKRIQAYNVSDAMDPIPLLDYSADLSANIRNFAKKEGYSYIAAGGSGFHIFDINSSSSEHLSHLGSAGASYDIEKVGSNLFVANNDNGLLIFDYSDESAPYFLGALDMGYAVREVQYHAGYLYVMDRYDGLKVLDVSDPSSPIVISEFSNLHNFEDFYIYENYILLCQYNDGVLILDISDPEVLTETGKINTLGNAVHCTAQNDLVFVAERGDGLSIYDISDPSIPVELAFLEGIGSPVSVDVSGDLAIVGNPSSKVHLIDISDPGSPLVLSTEFTKRAYAIDIFEDYAFISAGYAGLYILDVSNPEDPVNVDIVDTPGDVYNIFRDGNKIFIADLESGLRLLEFDDVSSISIQKPIEEIVTIFPNPGTENINVLIPSKKASPFRIRLTGIDGKDLGIIYEGEINPGENIINLDLSSYQSINKEKLLFLTVEMDNQKSTKVLVLLK